MTTNINTFTFRGALARMSPVAFGLGGMALVIAGIPVSVHPPFRGVVFAAGGLLGAVAMLGLAMFIHRSTTVTIVGGGLAAAAAAAAMLMLAFSTFRMMVFGAAEEPVEMTVASIFFAALTLASLVIAAQGWSNPDLSKATAILLGLLGPALLAIRATMPGAFGPRASFGPLFFGATTASGVVCLALGYHAYRLGVEWELYRRPSTIISDLGS